MRVLFLCHNHPALQPGGTEVMAHSLFRELRARHGVEGLFLAAVTGAHRERRPGTMLQAVPGAAAAADEMLVWLGHFDRFMLGQPDTYGLASLAPLIEEVAPEVVHVHHPLLFGLETIDLIRRLAPQARMVFTAHDFFPLCAQEGQLLTTDGRLCPGPALDRCQRCFPGRTATDFQLRDLAVRDAFRAFDLILTPSAFARDRYISAGWAPERFAVVPNGLPEHPGGTAPAPYRALVPGETRRDRFGFFGHINRYKGGLVLLQASHRLSEQGVAHRVSLHGGTAYQTDAFLEEVQAALAEAPAARMRGPYLPADQAALMAEVDWVVVPSVWWENAPLVVLEAFRHRRPVICGGVGGMAEMVRDGVDGLHAPVNDPAGLAQVLRAAIETEGLWERLVAGIRPPPTMSEVATLHMQHYRRATAALAA
jgi:glycosyltransferase involved in cell wall biosynthesis